MVSEANTSFDVIITTNNRAKSLKTLVEQLILQIQQPNKIIIVDSSLEKNSEIQIHEKVIYIHACHSNQPYQRYVGFLVSVEPILIYLDDDMELVNESSLKLVIDRFSQSSVAGLAINFINDNEFLNKSLPKSKFVKPYSTPHGALKWLKRLSGQPVLNDGKYTYNGLKGVQPEVGGQTQWFSGGAFAVRQRFMYRNFNFKLFDIYEKGLGKGEDGITGYTVSKNGNLYFYPDQLVLHNDKKDSVYTKNIYSFSRRVSYSRLYLTYEYCRLDNKKMWRALPIYHWYIFWRVIGMVVNQVLGYQGSRQDMIKGYLSGWWLASKERRELCKFSNGSDWKKEAERDIES